MPQLTVRLKALDGTWETCGTDRIPGVVPESVRLEADGWGSKTVTFDLRRDPAQVWPDISAFTPVTIDVDGLPVWSGRVAETPSRDDADRVMSVSCEGWQAHLDDDLVDGMWVHNDMSAWQDLRGFPGVALGTGASQFPAAPQVQTGQQILLSWPKGIEIQNGTQVGVMLDLGPNRTAKRITVTWQATDTTGDMVLFFRGNPSGNPADPGYSDAATPTWNTALTTTTGTFTNPCRYVLLFVYRAGVTWTATKDVWQRLSNIIVYGDTSFESGNASVLKASRVVTDAVAKGTIQLSQDTSGITASSFNIPEFAPDQPSTPRELISQVNGWHGWQTKVDVAKRIIFQPQPARPKYVVGDWSGVKIEDSSQNSGQDIYNRVVVTASDPAGQHVRVDRSETSWVVPQDLYWPNPSFDTNAASWFGDPYCTVSRTTTGGEFDSSPGGGKVVYTAPATRGAVYTQTTGGAVTVGRQYRATMRLRFGVTPGPAVLILGGASVRVAVTTSFQTFSVVSRVMWSAAPYLELGIGEWTNSPIFVDSLQLHQRTGTLIDRRGFQRTKQLQVNATLPSDGQAAAAIGDLWLSQHSSTPFRGTVTITGPGALRDRLTGQPVPPAQLLRDTGELIHFSNRVDPDTGAIGRNGRIAAVQYQPDTDTATITLDNNRADFDALMARLAVVSGTGA